MTNEFNRISFHDQKLIDIRRENYDVIIVAKNDEETDYG